MRLFAVALFALLTAAFASQAAPPTSSAPLLQSPIDIAFGEGTKHSGNIDFYGHHVTLPSGEWTTALARALGPTTEAPEVAEVFFVQIDGRKLLSVFLVTVSVAPLKAGFPITPGCKPGAMIWKDIREALARGRQDCTEITPHWKRDWSGSGNGMLPAFAAALSTRGIDLPADGVTLSVGEYTSTAFLFAGYFVHLASDIPGPGAGPAERLTNLQHTAAILREEFIHQLGVDNGLIAPPPASPAKPAVGAIISQSIVLGGRSLPLPPGDWVVAVDPDQLPSREASFGSSASVVLIQSQGSSLKAMLLLLTNRVAFKAGNPVANMVCTSTAGLWRDVRSADPQGNQDCALIVSEYPSAWRTRTDDLHEAINRSLDDRGIQFPSVVVEELILETTRVWSLIGTYYAVPSTVDDGLNCKGPSPAQGGCLIGAPFLERVKKTGEDVREWLRGAAQHAPELGKSDTSP